MKRRKGGLKAVSALNISEELHVVVRHRGLLYLLVVDLPDLTHRDHRDPAHRAGVVAVGQHVVEAGFVYEVVAGRDL